MTQSTGRVEARIRLKIDAVGSGILTKEKTPQSSTFVWGVEDRNIDAGGFDDDCVFQSVLIVLFDLAERTVLIIKVVNLGVGGFEER